MASTPPRDTRAASDPETPVNELPPTPDEGGPHDVPDDEVIEQTKRLIADVAIDVPMVILNRTAPECDCARCRENAKRDRVATGCAAGRNGGRHDSSGAKSRVESAGRTGRASGVVTHQEKTRGSRRSAAASGTN